MDGTDGGTGLIGGDASNGLDVDVTRVQGTVTTAAAGSIAHDDADSTSNPVKVGARATNSLDDATMVAAADRTNLYADIDGVLLVKQNCPLADRIRERVSNTNGTSTDFSNFGAVASTRNIIDQVTIYNDSTTNGYVDIRDGSAGSVLWTFPAPAKGGGHYALPPGAIASTANTALAYDVSAALTTVYISVSGFRTKAF